MGAHAPNDRPAPDYNYERFAPERYDLAAFHGPQVGEPFPDVEVARLDGGTMRISDLRGHPVVLETGSISCPVFMAKRKEMTEVAYDHPEARFLVLYTREAHPGTRLGPHLSMDDKRRNAEHLREAGERRVIVLDDVRGSLHKRLGSLPDSVYVLDEEGTVVFRAPWNDPDTVETVLKRLQHDQPMGDVLAEPRYGRVGQLVALGRRAGWDAVWDLVSSIPRIRRTRQDRRTFGGGGGGHGGHGTIQ